MWPFRKPKPGQPPRALTDDDLIALNGRLSEKLLTIEKLKLMEPEEKEALKEKARRILREEAHNTLCDTH